MANGPFRAIDQLIVRLVRMKGMALKIALTDRGGVQEILELSEAELVQVL